MLSIERSGYYAWLNKKPGKRKKSNDLLDHKVKTIFTAHQGRYDLATI